MPICDTDEIIPSTETLTLADYVIPRNNVKRKHLQKFFNLCEGVHPLTKKLRVPLRRKFVGLFRPNSVAEYRVVSIFSQKTEQETVHPDILSSKAA